VWHRGGYGWVGNRRAAVAPVGHCKARLAIADLDMFFWLAGQHKGCIVAVWRLEQAGSGGG
jgi:hypothetical protein